jgi:histone acetyltransferase
MFGNCRLYNSPDTIYYKLANKLEAEVNTFLSSNLIFDSHL